MKLFNNCYMSESLYKFNQKRHKYICCVWYDNFGYVHISGDNHEKRYLYYPWREAVKMYNTEARERAKA